MAPIVSIIICTRNRAEHLAETLASIGLTDVDAALLPELIVVDNGSTDGTRAVVENAGLTNMPVRYLSVAEPGQCRARNHGIRSAQGGIILFTDDDVRVPADWIEQMCGPILRGQTRAVAGSITMAPHLKREWMTQLHRNWLLEYNFANVPSTGVMIGANMAFDKELFYAVGGFDEDLGPGALGFSDDVLFSYMVGASGTTILGSGSTVEHHFVADRMQRQHLLKRAYQDGRCHAYLSHHFWKVSHRFVVLKWLRAAFWEALRKLSVPLRGKRPDEEGCPDWELNVHLSAAHWNHYRAICHTSRKHGNWKPAALTPRKTFLEAASAA